MCRNESYGTLNKLRVIVPNTTVDGYAHVSYAQSLTLSGSLLFHFLERNESICNLRGMGEMLACNELSYPCTKAPYTHLIIPRMNRMTSSMYLHMDWNK